MVWASPVKVLLVTTSLQNPGDLFICNGVQQLLREVNPSIVTETLDKEDRTQWLKAKDPSFDKIIWCGMPLFWSFPTHCSQDIYWWEGLLRPLMSNRRKDFAIIGAGTVGRVAGDADKAFTNPDQIKSAFEEVLSGCAVLTLRDDCLAHLLPTLLKPEVLPCPGFFAASQNVVTHQVTCNLMPNAGHYPELEPTAPWHTGLNNLTKILLAMDAFFCAHNDAEVELSKKLGWPNDRISQPEASLSHLKGTGFHIGNRIHSAIVAASVAKSVCIGYDLRLRAAQLCGCQIVSLAEHKYPFPDVQTVYRQEVRERYLEILRAFLA